MSIRRASKSSISTTTGRSKGSNLLAGYSPAIDEMDLIQRITVTSAEVDVIDFTSIPSNYRHLQIRMIYRNSKSVNGQGHRIRINNDTGANYSWHYISGIGSAVQTSNGTSQTLIYSGIMAGAGQLSNAFSGVIIDIPNYSLTNVTKPMNIFWGLSANSSSSVEVSINSGCWYSTAAINRITLIADGTNRYVQNTTASLYGVIG